MGKDKRRRKDRVDDRYDPEREERLLQQLKRYGRIATPPPGHFHDTDESKQSRKQRKKEKTKLKDVIKDYNRR